jgi:hypothetical protein
MTTLKSSGRKWPSAAALTELDGEWRVIATQVLNGETLAWDWNITDAERTALRVHYLPAGTIGTVQARTADAELVLLAALVPAEYRRRFADLTNALARQQDAVA